jgi:hypothetical protein
MDASTASVLRKAANITTISELLLAEAVLITERTGTKGQLNWSSTFSERQWDTKVWGGNWNISVLGCLWGKDGGNQMITYSGSGSVAGEPIIVHGRADWLYEPTVDDYQAN